MTKEEMIARIATAIEKAGASPADIATAVVEELQQEEEKPFPQDWDDYYHLNTVGYPIREVWHNSSQVSVDRLAIGNVFRSREEAEHHVTNLKTLAILRKHAAGEEWVPKACRWTITTNSHGEWTTHAHVHLDAGTIVYPSKAAAQAAIDEVGQEALNNLMG